MHQGKITVGTGGQSGYTPDTWWAHFKIFAIDVGWHLYTLGKWALGYALLCVFFFAALVAAGFAIGLGERLAGVR